MAVLCEGGGDGNGIIRQLSGLHNPRMGRQYRIWTLTPETQTSTSTHLPTPRPLQESCVCLEGYGGSCHGAARSSSKKPSRMLPNNPVALGYSPHWYRHPAHNMGLCSRSEDEGDCSGCSGTLITAEAAQSWVQGAGGKVKGIQGVTAKVTMVGIGKTKTVAPWAWEQGERRWGALEIVGSPQPPYHQHRASY